MKIYQKLTAVSLILLGGISMTLFSGCQDNGKNSREFIEGKAAKLSKAYPTQDLFDLFDKFPNGFHFHSITFFDKRTNASTIQRLELEGDSAAKEIKGKVIQKRTEVDKDGNRKETTQFDSEVTYTKEGFVFSNPDVDESDLRHQDFLLQKFTINKESLSKLKMASKSYSWETGAADITYTLQDQTVNQFFSLDKKINLKMWITMNENTVDGNIFSYSLTFTGDGVHYVENIHER